MCRDQVFEPFIVNTLVHFIKPDSTFFDVGANLGMMSLPVLKACPASRVVSFEPSPSSLPYLRKTLRESSYRARWTVVEKALWQERGEMAFGLQSIRGWDFMYEHLSPAGTAPEGRSVRVPVSLLDAEWASLGEPPVSLIKIDVEGAEAGVLAGGTKLLQKCRPTIVLEWYEGYLKRFGTKPDQLLAFARDFGYSAHALPTGVPVSEPATLEIQMVLCQNFVLVPKL
jgi:FkbM family methyltransferase